MKNKLIALSKEKGFKSKIILFDDYKSLSDTKYYLWLCELKMWMYTGSGVLCMADMEGHLKEWHCWVDIDDLSNVKTVYASIGHKKDPNNYPSEPQALEVALYEGLKLTEKKVK